MAKTNCNNLRDFIKCVDPVGDSVTFNIEPETIVVKGIGSSNEMIIDVSIEMPTGFTGKKGYSLDVIKKLIPKGIDDVDIEWGHPAKVTATGYKASFLSINEMDCARVPSKELVVDEGGYITHPQILYERLSSLKSAFDGQAFRLVIDPAVPNVITFSDEDNVVGTMSNSIVVSEPLVKDTQSYPYEIAMPLLNSVRLICDMIRIRFMTMPANEGCKALVFQGATTRDINRIRFTYIVAPRLKDV